MTTPADSIAKPQKKPCIVEDVPDVPRKERFYISGVKHLAEHAPHQYEGFPCFETKWDAEMFLARFGIMEFDVEWYSP